MIEAIIFDLDGTLWDSTGCACDIWNRVFEKHNVVNFRMTQEKVSELMGKTMEEISEILFPNFSYEKRKSIVDDFGDEEVNYLYENGAFLYDGIEKTIELLSHQYNLYIVSNCQDGYIPAFLHAHKLGRYFKDIEMSGRTGMDKGRNIRLLMKRNDIKSAVYIGDTEGDEIASRYAEIPFVWAKYGFGNAVLPDAVIESISELPQIILDLQ